MRRTLVVLAVIFVLLHVAGSTDFLSSTTRPVVTGLHKLFGVSAQDTGSELVLGRLHVPWTRDCAGLNILIVLWAVTLWANRAEPLSRLYWLRLALAPAAAFLANICRIFTLIGYRHVFFPAVESPQLHYFIGFLWVMPLLPFFVSRAGREYGRYFTETLFLITALSLVSPFVQAPGGSLVTLATLLLLAKSHFTPRLAPARRLLTGLWVVAAPGIAFTGMESLWLPWLLLCPWFLPAHFWRDLSAWGLLIATIPLAAMHPVGRYVLWLAALLQVWKLMRPGTGLGSATLAPSPAKEAVAPFTCGALALLFASPFVASALSGVLHPTLRPPAGVMARELAANTFDLRLLGQAGNVDLVWYGPSGDGRHHTLPVCMRYRGIVAVPSGLEPSVFTDGKKWMREFFLQRGLVLTDYQTYVRTTLLPLSPPGVHIIASAPTNTVSAEAFARSALDLATRLNQLDVAQAHTVRQNP